MTLIKLKLTQLINKSQQLQLRHGLFVIINKRN